MNYRDLDISYSYTSQGNHNIADSFLIPALKCTKEYYRSVGFFSSGVLETIMEGIVPMARNGGTIKLIASPRLNEEDIEAINRGYEQRESVIASAFSRDYREEVGKLDELRLQLLTDLIREGILDIKIAVSEGDGMYHDKLGILRDFEGNTLVFYGSPNSSYGGYRANYEKIRVVKGWEFGNSIIVHDEEKEFDSLWNNNNSFVETFEYKEIALKNNLEIIKNKRSEKEGKTGIELRDYQKEAIQAWVNNGYKGFYVMATGTGKTWTAIFSAMELLKKHQSMIVICAPYKHLIKQWAEDIEKAFPTARTVLISSENPTWDQQIADEIIKCGYDSNRQLVLISTIKSFSTRRFIESILKYNGDRLLIVDEAHRFARRPEILKDIFKYRLGLSATPFSGRDAARGKELMQFFGGQVFDLPIETALDQGFLVPYYYHPIFVYATEDEEDKFKKQTSIILSCFKNNICIDPDRLVRTLRNRLRIISMAEEKTNNLDVILDQIEEKDHVVVYCGDGKLFDNDTGRELRHIQFIKKMLSCHDHKSSQFTATENMQTRMELVDSFNKGEITALAAIRCLDEGINIPSIKSALILSSNDDYREFVQRRGRILRTYKGKESAHIYDVIVLPQTDLKAWMVIELRRYLEYARLSLNWDELEPELEELMSRYGICLEDIDVFDYDEMEGDLDE